MGWVVLVVIIASLFGLAATLAAIFETKHKVDQILDILEDQEEA